MNQRLLAAALSAALLGLTGCPAKEPQPTAPLPTETVGSTQDRALLLSVLDGETEISVEADFYNDLSNGPDCGLESGTRLTLSGLTEHLGDMFLYPEQERLDVSYALLETLGGREMLALRCLSGNDGADSTNFYLILGAFDGQVRLVYARDFWYRSYTDLSAELIFNGEGSSGAGDHFSWCGYIDDVGRYRPVYEMETLLGQWVAMHAYEVFGMDSDWAQGCECYLLETDSGKFYQLVAGEDVDEEKLALLREYLEDDQGRAEVADASAAIDAAMDAYGIPDAQQAAVWTHWEANT